MTRTSSSHQAANKNRPQHIGLISCVKTKQPKPSPARDLYKGPYFRAMRAYVEASCDDYRILSAVHGVLHPATRTWPYQTTLNDFSRAEREAWAHKVLRRLQAEFPKGTVFQIHGGEAYTSILAPLLERHGYAVVQPVPRLRIGERLQWYATNPPRSMDASEVARRLAEALQHLMSAEGGEPDKHDPDGQAAWREAHDALRHAKRLGLLPS